MNRKMAERLLAQNDVTAMRNEGIDLAPRWEEILREIAGGTGFVPDKELLRESEWWKTGKVGAVHCPGIILAEGRRKRVVLKIQGTRPATSEAEMIWAFERVNQSKRIRSPEVFGYLPWDAKKQFEALILEEVQGVPVIETHPAKREELNAFFDLYEEYRSNCREESVGSKTGEMVL